MYSFINYLLRPYTLALLFLAIGLVLTWRRRREGRRQLLWVVVPFLALVGLSLPAVGHLAVGSLEWRHPPLADRPQDVGAIVVLGSSVLAPDRGRERPELDSSAVHRCLEAARLYRQGKPCPVLVSGGKPDPTVPGPACAELMAELLVRLGVSAGDVLVESASRTTYENAVESRKVLEGRQVSRVVLVTEASHLRRAVLCFRKQGLEVVPAGGYYRKTEFGWSLQAFLPTVSALSDCETAAHEWVGLAWYWLRGRV
jgi:uncharacterized SAM-binding protein YcdF (DUF218 family)